MRILKIQPQARVDLLDIRRYIAQDVVIAADRVLEKLDQAILRLWKIPNGGNGRQDVANPDYRFWNVYSYVIAYRYDAYAVVVIRVVHGARDSNGFSHSTTHAVPRN